MLRKLLAFLWTAHLLIAQPSGRLPSALIEDSVNLITGECTILTEDMEVRGAEPLNINRLYINGTKKKKYAGWIFMPHLRLYRIIPFDGYKQYVDIYEPDGTPLRFYMPDDYERGKPTYLEPGIESTFQLQSRANRNTISGKNNIKNIKVYMTGNRNYIHVKSANGCERVYKECEALEYEDTSWWDQVLKHEPTNKIRKYLLQSEDLPSGNQIKYEYDNKTYKVKTIRLVNPNRSDKVLSEWKYTKIPNNKHSRDYRIETSDGQIADYIHDHHDVDKERYEYTLASFSSIEKPIEEYTYSSPNKERGRLIQDRKFASKATLTYTYYEMGKNPTKYHNIKITDKADFRIDRVKEIKRNSEVSYTFEYGVNADESGWTKIHDALGNHSCYYYNKLHQIIKIERYDSKKQLQNIDIYVYGKEDRKADLLAAITLDNTGAPLIAQTYVYDDWGNIIEETVWGNITGRSKAKLTLDSNSLPIHNGVDKSTKTFRHSQDGKNLLLYERDENDLETIYDYYDSSYRIKSKFIKLNGKILRRTFYEYNHDHLLVKETQDDGSSEDQDSYVDVTEQHLFKTHRYNDGLFIGMPEWIEESYIDLKTGHEILAIKTHVLYYLNRKVHEKRVYDNRHQLAYTQIYGYDAHNNLISETDPSGRKATATYNDFRKKETFTDFDGLVKHTFAYDDLGRLNKTTHNDKVESCTYNAKDQVDSKTDRYGNTTTLTYDSLGNLTETKLPDGTILKTHFNALSYPISQIDGEGHTTTIRPNIFNKPLEIHHPDGTTETYRYHLTGNLAEAIQPHGTVTSYEYDHFNRLTTTTISYRNHDLTKETCTYSTLHLKKKTDPLGQTITYDYDGAGRKILETDGTLTTHFGYDPLGRLSTVKTGSCTKTTHYDLLDLPRRETIHDSKNTLVSDITYDYDTFNNKTSTRTSIEGRISEEQIKYDNFSRPILLTDPMGNVTTISYNDRYQNSQGKCVLRKTETSPIGNQTIILYDILGRVESVEVISPLGDLLTRCTYQYDHNNNCLAQTDTVTEETRAWHIKTKREYTPTNEIKKLIEAVDTQEQKTTLYHYDTSGRLDYQTDPNGTVITYAYNPLNQIETLTTTNVAYEYHYDLLGRIIEVKDLINHTSTLRTYDSQGNLEEETLGNGLTLHSDYDPEGRRKLLTLPDQSTIRYDYDDYYLRAITRTNQQTTYTHQLLEYDLSSNLLAETNTTHHYNLNGAQEEIHTPILTQIVTNRDKLGNILTQTTNSTLETFTYTPLSQLTSEPHHKYTYDTIHNRTSKDTQPYTYNNANQLRQTPTEKFDYDTAGYPYRKTTPTETTHYTYDGLGRLIEAHTPHWRITFTYDSFHRCLTRTLHTPAHTTTQHFLYDDTCEIGSTDENQNIFQLRILKDTTQAEIGSAIALELNNIVYTPIHDLRGNICALLQDDTLIETTHYTAYGEASHSTLNPWTYRSKRYDPQLQLINFGRRFYDPTTGRFFTPDPKGFVDGLNLYAYCHNNPLNKIDLYGLNIHVEFSMNLSTALSIASFATSMVGNIIYHTFDHCMPVPGFREAGMAVGNVLSRNWTRPVASETSSLDRVRSRERKDCSFLAINGVLNKKAGAEETANYFSSCLDGYKVDYFHSSTRGLLSDVLSSFCGILGFQTADSIEIALIMRRQIQILNAQSQDPKLFVFAHSRGGIYLGNALRLMSPEERRVIHVYTFGSASLFQDNGLAHLRHNVAAGDPIPLCDSLNYARARLLKSSNVHFLAGQGNFYSRHLVLEETYSQEIRQISKRILSMIGE